MKLPLGREILLATGASVVAELGARVLIPAHNLCPTDAGLVETAVADVTEIYAFASSSDVALVAFAAKLGLALLGPLGLSLIEIVVVWRRVVLVEIVQRWSARLTAFFGFLLLFLLQPTQKIARRNSPKSSTRSRRNSTRLMEGIQLPTTSTPIPSSGRSSKSIKNSKTDLQLQSRPLLQKQSKWKKNNRSSNNNNNQIQLLLLLLLLLLLILKSERNLSPSSSTLGRQNSKTRTDEDPLLKTSATMLKSRKFSMIIKN